MKIVYHTVSSLDFKKGHTPEHVILQLVEEKNQSFEKNENKILRYYWE